MKNISILFAVFFLSFPASVFSEKLTGYVGSGVCKKCHESIYNQFIDSGHPFKIRSGALGKAAGFPLPKGYSWDDIFYVIGGENKKIRYIDHAGFIITTDKNNKPMPTQYNMADGKWVDYHAGEKKPYQCGPCHMTAYKKQGHQYGRIGIIGTWALDGIQCEECHGPGSNHLENPEKNKLKIDTSSSACGKCHIRGQAEKIPAKAGFIRHHEQYNELLMGSHKDKDCITCHNPHAKAKAGIISKCVSCHKEVDQNHSKKIHANIDCIECHMPYIGKSASSVDNYVGDVRTHLFQIDINKDYKMFTPDGKYAKSKISLTYACLSCHKSRDRKWAADHAKNFHKKHI